MVFLDTKKYYIIWTLNFKNELKNIFNYLNYFLNVPLTAEKLHQKLVASLTTLEYFPERYTKITNTKFLTSNSIHRVIIDNYIIIYEVNRNTRSSFYFTYFSLKPRLF